MAEDKNSGCKPKRVFINNVDSYASKHIAEFLSKCRLISADDEDEREEVASAFHLVGTADRQDGGRPHMLEEYPNSNRGELLLKLMGCDVIIYDITQQADQVEEALWAVSGLHSEMEHFPASKLFILISTVMTWAHTSPLDPEDPSLPLTDELFWRRRPHPNFKPHWELEKRVVKLGKTNKEVFATYVVASGCLYGKGEQFLHYFFKTAWLGGQREILLFGDGNNTVPMIHVSDLASVIQNVIERTPLPGYLLAVDNSNNTMEETVKAIACALGPGEIQKKPVEEAFLIPDFSVLEMDALQLNLCMDSAYVKELLPVRWSCESGLVENIELVVKEYRQSRNLLPIGVCVLGPPAAGKSTVSKHICQYYRLHHISLKETISETITQLEDAVNNPHADAEHEDSVEETKMLLDSLRDSMATGFVDEQLKVKVVKEKLLSWPCRNQGFVLDSFPETWEQARELFSSEGNKSEAPTSLISSCSQRIIPEFVFYLDASDEFLKERVKNLPERLVQEKNYEQELFLQRLAKYREDKLKNESVLHYFDETDISPVILEINSDDKSASILWMHKVFETIGRPRNYDVGAQDGQHQESREEDKGIGLEQDSLSLKEPEQREEEKQRAGSSEWMTRLEKVTVHEEKQLEVQSDPVRSYLLEHVMPTLTQGLTQCCRKQPQDPLDFLAEYLLRNNPLNY